MGYECKLGNGIENLLVKLNDGSMAVLKSKEGIEGNGAISHSSC